MFRTAPLSRYSGFGRADRERMRKEKGYHCARCIRAAGIGVASGSVAARPGMAGAMDGPLLDLDIAIGGAVPRAGVGPPRQLVATVLRYSERPIGLAGRMGNDVRAVDRMDGGIAVSVKGDHRNETAGPISVFRLPGPVPHRRKS